MASAIESIVELQKKEKSEWNKLWTTTSKKQLLGNHLNPSPQNVDVILAKCQEKRAAIMEQINTLQKQLKAKGRLLCSLSTAVRVFTIQDKSAALAAAQKTFEKEKEKFTEMEQRMIPLKTQLEGLPDMELEIQAWKTFKIRLETRPILEATLKV